MVYDMIDNSDVMMIDAYSIGLITVSISKKNQNINVKNIKNCLHSVMKRAEEKLPNFM